MPAFQCHIEIETANYNIVELVAKECSLTNSQIKMAINKGALWLTKGKKTRRVRRLKTELSPGNSLHFYYDDKVLAQTVSDAKLIADFQDYSIWYKPYGMLCQGSKWSDHCTINRYIEQTLMPTRPAIIIHRLDRAATGLIIIAHSKSAAKALTQMFEQRQLSKYYQIIVHGHAALKQHSVTTEIDGKAAKSSFSLLDYDALLDMSLLDVKIDTGRKHQIRKHAASIGLPVVGDRLHGLSQPPPQQTESYKKVDLQLCAVKLEFTCPISGTLRQVELNASLKPSLASIKALINTCGA